MEFDADGEPINCKYPSDDNGCRKCIKDWLEQEAVDEQSK